MKEIYGVSRTRDRKGNVVRRNLRPFVNCIHVPCGYENMLVLVAEVEDEVSDAFVIRYERSEEMKALRRKVGDNGGIKFQGKKPALRLDACSNTITCVLKDNMLVEIYE